MINTFSDDDTNSDDDNTRMNAMVVNIDNQIDVQANLQYKKRFINVVLSPGIIYAICDSAADSCVVGKIAKIENVIMKTANLVGYDPQTTQSFNLPFVNTFQKTV